MVIRQIPGRDCDTLKRACGQAVDKVTDAERAGLSREIDQAVERLQALKSDLRPRLQQVKP